MKLCDAIQAMEGIIEAQCECMDCNNLVEACEMAIEALYEKQQRDNAEQWLDDMNNPLEPIKVDAALKSEIMKLNYRMEHKPESVNELDYTIIAALMYMQGISMRSKEDLQCGQDHSRSIAPSNVESESNQQ